MPGLRRQCANEGALRAPVAFWEWMCGVDADKDVGRAVGEFPARKITQIVDVTQRGGDAIGCGGNPPAGQKRFAANLRKTGSVATVPSESLTFSSRVPPAHS
jgi:hypothetical protein